MKGEMAKAMGAILAFCFLFTGFLGVLQDWTYDPATDPLMDPQSYYDSIRNPNTGWAPLELAQKSQHVPCILVLALIGSVAIFALLQLKRKLRHNTRTTGNGP